MAKKRTTPINKTGAKRTASRGRPFTYNPKFHPQAAKALCAKGEIVAELATAFDVAISTIWQWKRNYPEFIESCRLGLEAATDRVEQSMFERAVGYTHDSVKVFLPAGANKPVYAPYLKHVPDPRAGEFWLTNRAPDRWKRQAEHRAQRGRRQSDPPVRTATDGYRHPPAPSRAQDYRARRRRAERNPSAAARRSHSERNYFHR